MQCWIDRHWTRKWCLCTQNIDIFYVLYILQGKKPELFLDRTEDIVDSRSDILGVLIKCLDVPCVRCTKKDLVLLAPESDQARAEGSFHGREARTSNPPGWSGIPSK